MFLPRRIVILLAVLAFWASPVSVFSGDWQVHTSMSTVRDMIFYNGKIYAATAGGLLVLHLPGGQTDRYSLNDGIGGTAISAIAVDPQSGRIFLGMDGGNLTVLEGNTFRVYTDFNGRTGFKFNDLYVYQGVLLIATNEGLSLFDLRIGKSPIVEPSFNNFGESVFHNRDPEIRDVFVVNDSIFALNRFFWATQKIIWNPPIMGSNAETNFNLPGNWTTNGSQGDFAYRVLVEEDEYDTTGFSHFFREAGTLVGLLDNDIYRGPDGGIYGLDGNSSQFWIHEIKKGSGPSPFGNSDTLFYSNANSGASQFNCLVIDDKGNAYVGTNNRGILRLPDQTLFWNGDEQTFTAINHMAIGPYGNIYATNVRAPGNAFGNTQTSLGILKFDGNTWTHLYAGHDPFQTVGVNAIALDRAGRLFSTFIQDRDPPGGKFAATYDRGIVVFNNPFLPMPVTASGKTFSPGNFEIIRYLDQNIFVTPPEWDQYPVVGHIPTALYIDGDNKFFLSYSERDEVNYEGRIRIFRDGSLKKSTSYQKFSLNSADYGGQSTSAFKQLGEIFVPQNEGYQLNGHFSYLTTDHAGNIWATNSGSFISTFTVFGLDQNRSTNDTLIFDQSGPTTTQSPKITNELWETGREGIAEAKRGLDALLGAKSIKKIGRDLFGDIWIATASGLHYYSEGVPSTKSLPYNNVEGIWRYFLPDIGINDFDFDSLNNVWIATEGFGLKMLEFSTAKYFTSTSEYGQGQRDEIKMNTFTRGDGLMDTRVSSIAVDRRNGKVWLGFGNGLQSFDTGIRLAEDISEGYVYPVLFRRKVHQEVFLNSNQNESTISIFTISGKLIASKSLSKLQSSWKWDTRTSGGNLSAPGIYLYRFTAKNGKHKTGKFAIIP